MASVGMQQSVVPTGLPVLPGNGFKDPTKVDFKKSHIFDVKNGITVNKDPASTAPKGPIATVEPPKMYSKGENTVVPVQPAWVAFDRKVLRFNCYFKESVHESRLENYRIRKCVLYYYLEDDSMHVSEPKVENSGIPQARSAALTAHRAWAAALRPASQPHAAAPCCSLAPRGQQHTQARLLTLTLTLALTYRASARAPSSSSGTACLSRTAASTASTTSRWACRSTCTAACCR